MKLFKPTLTLLLLALACRVLAFPDPQGRINDFANVLGPGAKAKLQAIVDEVEVKTTAEIAVVTIPSLDGMSVEEYANGLFKQWGIGKKGKDNGLLILICPGERKMRVEVGYGLEGTIPDGLAGSVIRRDFTPAFKKGDYDGGTLAGTRRLADFIEGSENAETWLTQRDMMGWWKQILLALFFSIFIYAGFSIFGGALVWKKFFLMIFGLVFGGVPLAITIVGTFFSGSVLYLTIVGSFLNEHILSIWVPLLLSLEAILVTIWSYLRAKKLPDPSVHTWMGNNNTPGSGSSGTGSSSGGGGFGGGGSGGGGFGGGGSGGGGASGSW